MGHLSVNQHHYHYHHIHLNGRFPGEPELAGFTQFLFSTSYVPGQRDKWYRLFWAGCFSCHPSSSVRAL